MRQATRIRWDILEEHLDEAAFLWEQWERACSASNYRRSEVAAGPEARLLAHLDGLVLGGTAIEERLLLPALASDDVGAVFSAAWVLLQSEHVDHLELVWQALLGAEGEARRAMTRALELSLRRDLPDRLLPKLGGQGALADSAIIDVVAVHQPERLRTLPLQQMAAAAPAELIGAVLRAVPHDPDAGHRSLIERGLESRDPETLAAAIAAGTLCRVPSTRAVCRRLVAERAADRRLGMIALALLGDANDHARLWSWTGSADVANDALWALAFTGRTDDAERLLASLDDPRHAAVAADSFGFITGLEVVNAHAAARGPSPLDEPSNEDGLPEVDADDDLAAPHADAIRAWWKSNAARFAAGARYLCGAPHGPEAVRAAFEHAATWRRHGLRLMPGAPAIHLRRWARMQVSA